jgi:MFS family permease
MDPSTKVHSTSNTHLHRRRALRVPLPCPPPISTSNPPSLDTGTIGPLTTMPQFRTTFGALSSTVHGLVVSTILIPAALSSLFGGHLANKIGRLRGIAIGAAVFGIGAAGEASSVRLGMLIAGRAVKGLGEGLFLSTCVV